MRNNTERPVTIKQGTNMIVSTDKAKILEVCNKLIKGIMLKAKYPSFGMVKQLKDCFTLF